MSRFVKAITVWARTGGRAKPTIDLRVQVGGGSLLLEMTVLQAMQLNEKLAEAIGKAEAWEHQFETRSAARKADRLARMAEPDRAPGPDDQPLLEADGVTPAEYALPDVAP